ncbi:MAG: hypothetical protein NZ899_00395 [Thermoguttaceae bacterium]|nr:hypothetical protein [Thermoguttaceae bacterium]MDW8077355.1 hypothetical protein [Thermoguttaceae bacterium]
MIREAGALFEWGRLAPASILWIVPPALLLLGVVGLLTWWENRQAMSWRLWTLVALRIAALAALVLWFLEPRWRFLREREYPSQVAVLVDSSASMLLPESLPGTISSPDPGPGGISRWEAAIRLLRHSDLLAQLAKEHQVDVFTFDESTPELVYSWLGRPGGRQKLIQEEPVGNDQQFGDISGGGNHTNGTQPAQRFGKRASEQTAPSGIASGSLTPADFERALGRVGPRGRETRLGEALASVANLYPREVLAGIVVVSDGGQNAGLEVGSAVEILRTKKVPVFTIGLGPTSSPGDVRIAQVDLPAQVRPMDPFPILISLEADAYRGTVDVVVELEPKESRPASPGTEATSSTEKSVGADGQVGAQGGVAANSNLPAADRSEIVAPSSAGKVFRQQTSIEFASGQGAATARFEVALPMAGQYRVRIAVDPQPGDVIAQNNRREEVCEVVDRPLRVLLLSGGPSREFQFLRSVLFRDPGVRVDVFLQSAPPGAWQEADRLLEQLPRDESTWAEYDCLVAIDPDWRRVAGPSGDLAKVLDLIERWVGEQGGGLIFAAGAVYAADSVAGWPIDSRCQTVLRLLPVSLTGLGGLGGARMLTSSEPVPIDLTPEGVGSSFLWLEPGAEASQQAWRNFPGVYSCVDVRQLKRGATALAYLSLTESGGGPDRPIYLAEQFYGAGRVFYLGSCELWRLRAISERYYERLWLQLIRHASGSKLAGRSRRLFLTSDRSSYSAGETVFLRARAVDKRFEPIKRDSLRARVIGPEGLWEEVRLSPVAGEPGHYRGSFVCQQPGEYRATLSEPEHTGEEAECRFRVELASLEERTLVRNEELLRYLGEATGGRYYSTVQEVIDPQSPGYLPRLITPRSWVETVIGPPVEPTLGDLWGYLTGRLRGEETAGLSAGRRVLAIGVDSVLFFLAVAFLATEWLLRQLGRGSVF